MNNLKTALGIISLTSLLAVIIVTPANAQSKAIVMPVLVVKAPHCTIRELDQGSGSVRICE